MEVERKRKISRPDQLVAMLDGDHGNESEKERAATPDSEDQLDDIQLCIRKNKRLMQLYAKEDYRDRVLGTLA